MAAMRGSRSTPDNRLVRPRLSDDQLATLQRYGTVEPTTAGQVLFAAGDLSYDLIVLLKGRVEVSVAHEGQPWPIAAAGPRDFLAELNLLTGQRVYFTGVVTEAGSIVRVPRERVGEVIDRHGDLGAFLLQEMFRRRQIFLRSRAGVQIVDRAIRRTLRDCGSSPCGTGSRMPGSTWTTIAQLMSCSTRLASSPATHRSCCSREPGSCAIRRTLSSHRLSASPASRSRDGRTTDRDRRGACRAGRRGIRGIGGADHGSCRCGCRRRAGVDDLADRELSRLPDGRVRRGVRRAGVAPGGSVRHSDVRPPSCGRPEPAGRSLPGGARRRLPACWQVSHRRYRRQLPAA